VNCRSFYCAALFVALFFAPASKAQGTPMDSTVRLPLFRAETKEYSFTPAALQPGHKREGFQQKEAPLVRFHKRQFLVLSAAVYGASAADMHETMQDRNYSWWYEKDPLAKPLMKLPPPAYYAAGFTLATGVNWLSWEMGHSRRWHKLAAIPQLLSIAGNTYGFKSNQFSNR